MTPSELEASVQRRLQTLLRPRAPHTLLPRVMTAIQRRLERPWYARAVFTWPLAGQAACLAALLVVIGGVALWLPTAHDPAGGLLLSPLGQDTRIASAAARLTVIVNAIQVLHRTIIEPLYAYAAIPILTMCATTAVLAAALTRVAFGGAIRP